MQISVRAYGNDLNAYVLYHLNKFANFNNLTYLETIIYVYYMPWTW